MLIVEREVGNVVILQPEGRLDIHGREEFQRHLAAIVERGHRQLLLDMQHVDYIDSTAIGVLFGVFTSLQKRGGTILLANVNEKLRKLFTLVCLDGMIGICPDVDAALEQFARAS
jgi:anti-sigma B factor antagonist